MKKLSIFMLLIILLSACTVNSATPMKANHNTMVLNVRNNANFDIYLIEVNVSSNGGGATGGVMNADGSKISKGDILGFEYIDKVDFHLSGEKSFEIILLGNDQTNLVSLEAGTLELAPNREYLFEITGDSVEEVELVRVK